MDADRRRQQWQLYRHTFGFNEILPRSIAVNENPQVVLHGSAGRAAESWRARLYVDRIVGSHRYHCNSCGVAAPGAGQRKSQGEADTMRQ